MNGINDYLYREFIASEIDQVLAIGFNIRFISLQLRNLV